MSTFSKGDSRGDSALRDKAGSLWLASSIDTQVLSPYSPLHNPAFSSQNKRSGASVSSQVSLEILESTFQQSYHSLTAIPRILEEENQSSLRVDLSTKQSNSAQAESNQINGAHKACNLESVQGDWGVKGGIRGDASQVAPLSPLEKNSSKVSLKSSNNAKKVDSSVDCHADKSARNDSKNIKTQKADSSLNALFPSLRGGGKATNEAIHKNKAQKVDSRIFTQTAQPAHHDSRNSKETCCGFALHRCRLFSKEATLCGGAVVALRFLGKVSELGVRAFHKNRNTAALPTQSQIA